jgi:hypothetical protein
VVGAEWSHEVSNLGRVRSVDRIVTFPDGRRRHAAGQLLTPWMAAKSYAMLKINGQRRYVHDIVLEAFTGPKPEGGCVRHGRLGPLNNSTENICYGTCSENEYDKVRDGTHPNARKTHCPHGHEYTPENTRLYTKRGSRERLCRICQNAVSRESKRRRRAAT